MAPVYHVGRGGNGNVVSTTTGEKRRGSGSESESGSEGSKVGKGKKGLEWVKGLARK